MVIEHRLPDIPVKPDMLIEGAWEVWCHCGWGATCDSPEAAVIGAAHHLETSENERLRESLQRIADMGPHYGAAVIIASAALKRPL